MVYRLGEMVDEDLALVTRARAGDRVAFGELTAKYRASIERVVVRYVKDSEAARDVAQVAFLRAFEHLHTFRGESAFRSWIHRVAINCAIDQLHRREANHEAHWLELEDDMAFTRSLGTTRVSNADLAQKVSARLAELPTKQRLVVELRIYHDMAFAEIAEIAGCSENSAKVNFHHGIKRLRELAPKAE